MSRLYVIVQTSHLVLLCFADWPNRPPALWPRVHPPACDLVSVHWHPDCNQQHQGSSRSFSRLLLWASGGTLIHVNANISVFLPHGLTKEELWAESPNLSKDPRWAAWFWGTLNRCRGCKWENGLNTGGWMLMDLVHEKWTGGDSNHYSSSGPTLLPQPPKMVIRVCQDALWGEKTSLCGGLLVIWREVPDVLKAVRRAATASSETTHPFLGFNLSTSCYRRRLHYMSVYVKTGFLQNSQYICFMLSFLCIWENKRQEKWDILL